MRRPLKFWLNCALIGLVAALAAAAVAALWLTGLNGSHQLTRRGFALFTVQNVSYGAGLALAYLGFFALFVVPFAMALVPAAYAAATRLSRDPFTARIIFVILAMLGGTFGPELLQQGLITLQTWRGLSSGLRPLQLAELFIPFGIIAAPVGAWFIWPVLQRLDVPSSPARAPAVDASTVPNP